MLYRYNLTVEPLGDNEKKPPSEPKGKKLKRIISLWLKYLKQKMPSLESTDYIATDYKSNIVCSREVLQELWKTKITYLHEDDTAATARNNSPEYLVLLAGISPLRTSQLKIFLTSSESQAQYEHKEPMLQALNILFGHHAKSTPTTTMVGGNRAYTNHERTEKLPLGAGVQAVRGYFLSVRLCSFSSMVNVNVSHSAFYEAVPLANFMWKILCELGESEYTYYRLETFFRGIQVKTKLKDRSGKQVTKVISIKAFATIPDGRERSHPPIVDEYAAQPSKVWFHLDDASGFEKREKLKKKGAGIENYINVRDYFEISMCKHLWPQTLLLTNSF